MQIIAIIFTPVLASNISDATPGIVLIALIIFVLWLIFKKEEYRGPGPFDGGSGN